MERLRKFLIEHRSKSPQPANLYNLKGGRYWIKVGEREQFYELYTRAIPEFTERSSPALTFAPPKTLKQPLLLDFDLRTAEKPTTHTADFYTQLAVEIAEKSFERDQRGFALVMKPSPYKVTNKDGSVFWKSGFHLYFPESECDVDTAEGIRSNSFPLVESHFKGVDLLNTIDDVVDDCTVFRKNGLCFPGCFKGVKKGGRYNVVAHGHPDTDGNMNVVFHDKLSWVQEIPLSFLIDHAFCTERTVVEKKKKKKKTTKANGETSEVGEYKINLPAFLDALSGWSPDEASYKNICLFLANSDVCPNEAGTLCNREWNPPPDKLNETSNFITKWRGRSTMKPVVMQKLLEKHASKSYDVLKILPRKRYKYYNEYQEFVGKVNVRSEIEQYVADVISWISSERVFCWQYTVSKCDSYGNQFVETHTALTKVAPFKKNMDDVLLECVPTKAALVDAVNKAIDKCRGDADKFQKAIAKLNKPRLKNIVNDAIDSLKNDGAKSNQTIAQLDNLIEIEAEMNNRDFYEACKHALGKQCPDPSDVSLGKIVLEMQENHKLKRWESLTFQPYFGTTPTSHRDTFNVFTPFHLHTYEATKQYDVKETAVWRYLFETLSWENEKLFAYWLDTLADMIQRCHIRSERLGILRSKTQGNGKSSACPLFAGLLGEKYVTFHQSADRLLNARFNVQNIFKLVIFVDDISAHSSKDTRKLYSLATAHLSTLEKKGEKPVQIKEFSRIWLTSNADNPLFCTNEDRRQMVFDVSAKHKQDHAFFKQFYAEVKNLDVMKSWFDFLCARDISKFNQKLDPPTDAKNKTISACMPVAHRFISEFFVDNDWVIRWIGDKRPIGAQSVHLMKKTRGFRVKLATLFPVYTAWARVNYPNNRRVNRDLFKEQIVAAGVACSSRRQRMNNTTTFTADFHPKTVRETLKGLYPSKEFPLWGSEEDFSQFFQEASKY